MSAQGYTACWRCEEALACDNANTLPVQGLSVDGTLCDAGGGECCRGRASQGGEDHDAQGQGERGERDERPLASDRCRHRPCFQRFLSVHTRLYGNGPPCDEPFPGGWTTDRWIG